MAKSIEYNAALKNAKVQGLDNCKSILINRAKKAIAKAFPLMDDFQKELKLAQRTSNLFEGFTKNQIYKEFAQTFEHELFELTPQDECQIELSTRAQLGTL